MQLTVESKAVGREERKCMTVMTSSANLFSVFVLVITQFKIRQPGGPTAQSCVCFVLAAGQSTLKQHRGLEPCDAVLSKVPLNESDYKLPNLVVQIVGDFGVKNYTFIVVGV
jgi:hypothetical protein